MAIIYDGAGGLFTRLGKIIKASNALLTLQGAWNGVGTNADAILDEYDGRRDLVDGLLPTFDGLATQMASQIGQLKRFADDTLTDLQLELNAPSATVDAVLPRLYEQMVADGETVNASTVSAPTVAAVAGNTGNGSLVASKVDALGRDAETSITEVVRFVCIADSYNGGTAGGEQFSVTGYPEIDATAYGTRGNGNGDTLSVLNEGGSNIVENGDFDDFATANTPDNWTISLPASGGPGTVVFSEASTVYTAAGKALKLQGDGATGTVTISQNIAADVKPLTRYVLGFYARKGGGTFATGSNLKVWVTGAGVTTYLAFNADPTTLTTSYALKTLFFSTGEVVPTDLRVEITWTVAGGVASTGQIFIDDLAAGEAYAFGGIYYGLFKGATPFTEADAFTSATTNTEGVIQGYFSRQYGFQLPSVADASETLPDSLAT